MSPLEMIKNGLLNNDLKEIAQGYNALTGESISIGGEEPIAEMPEAPRSQPHAETEQPPVQVRSSDLDFSVKPREEQQTKYGRRQSIQVGENKFVDNGTEAKGAEFETPDVPLTPRRSPVQMVEVTCHNCGKKEEINPRYKVGTYHRCSECLG